MREAGGGGEAEWDALWVHGGHRGLLARPGTNPRSMADPGPRSLLYEGLLLLALVHSEESVLPAGAVGALLGEGALAGADHSSCAPGEQSLSSAHLFPPALLPLLHLLPWLQRQVLFGSWFQPVKGWLGLRDRLNFLLLTCEEMHQDLRGSVEWICQFLGKQQDAQALDGVVENASFQAMNQNKTCNYGLGLENIMEQWVSPFLRKGVPGDWKGHFMVAQSQVFDWLYREQMQDVSVRFPWDEA
ncbi:sulfotransferase 2B1-like [Gopherus evgoodei]|uniref:sulfotransferase 2B1-like n=1 Tax=Gopherus evgoodei TaxID=1825980 RepID=UPI0011CF56C1|nr:sulfotransferase 2B1-like [Gopherus evgoodei]